MKSITKIGIKDNESYFFSEMVNINDFDLNSLNIDEISFKNDKLTMNDIKYIKNLNSLNSIYLVFNKLDAYIKENGEKKYSVFAPTKNNKLMLKNYVQIWNKIKEQIELMTGNKIE